MEVTLSGRMGGPEVGASFLPGVVAVRRALKAALAPVGVDGVSLLDLEVVIGGSITDPDGFDATLRYSAQRARLLLVVTVPAAEARAVPPEDAARQVVGWLVRGFATARVPRSAQGLVLDPVVDALTSLRATRGGTAGA